jgi:uncharacterized OsmC-like protein
MTNQQVQTLNGFSPNELTELADVIATDVNQAQIKFQVSTQWVDGPRSISRVQSMEWGGQTYERDFSLIIDEPEEVGGTNLGPNPQEVLLSAFNSCVLATFAEFCTIEGIRLENVTINSSGNLDLRGFFGLDKNITPGYQALNWTLSVKGDATPEQFKKVYDATIAASPNLWNLMHPVRLVPQLQVEQNTNN